MQFINRTFDLKPGDLARGWPLFLYYFLIMTFYVLGRSARDSIFQDNFAGTLLPYGDIAVAAISSVLVGIYLRASRRANLQNLQIGTVVAFAAMLPLQWWTLQGSGKAATAAIFYVWVGVCGILAVSQVWMLANVVWTTREAKRLFGPLGSAGIIGGTVAGVLTKWIAQAFGTNAILIFMAAFLALCPPLVALVWRQRAHRSSAADESPARSASVRESASLVWRSRHLLAIAALVLLGSIVTSVAGWQYKVMVKAAVQHTNDVTGFYGLVMAYASGASLVAQLLLTSKLLRRFGLGLTLLLLPIGMMMGSAGVLIWGSLSAAAFLRASDTVIRYSVDTSAIQLLYLPVPTNIKLQVKSFIDTVVWKIGDGLSAVAILVFARQLGMSPRQMSVVTLVLIGFWILSAVIARREYVATLRANIQGAQLKPADVLVPTLDHATTNVLAEKLASPNATDVLYGLTLFEMGQRLQSHSAVRKLLTHPSPRVRSKAVAILNEASDVAVRGPVKGLLDDEDIDVRTEALRYLTRHDHSDPLAEIERLGDFPSAAVRSGAVAFLARPGEAQNLEAAGLILDGMVGDAGAEGRDSRLEAARLLSSLPAQFEDRLAVLLKDLDVDVAREAVQTAGLRRVRRFVPTILERLGQPALREDAIAALAEFEDGVIGTLRDHLLDPREAGEIRLAIPDVLLRIGTPAAAAALGEALLEPDLTLRFHVISALNKLQETRRDLVLDRQTIDAVMIAELMGHYRSYQLLGAQGGVANDALQKAMAHELERIFRLMKLLSPKLDLKEAYAGARSSDAVMHANALEFLDNTLSPEMRVLIVPLLDSEVTVAERVKLADRFLGFTAAQTTASSPTKPGRIES
jgi:AAA family ATP:ADP antiporter